MKTLTKTLLLVGALGMASQMGKLNLETPPAMVGDKLITNFCQPYTEIRDTDNDGNPDMAWDTYAGPFRVTTKIEREPTEKEIALYKQYKN